jgi:diaminopimelate decarboxylase
MEDIIKICINLKTRVDVALRINPTLLIKEFAIKMGGQATQFGIDEEKLEEVIEYLRQNDNSFNFKGIHVYSGTQCMSEEAILKNVENVLSIAKKVEQIYHLPCSRINLGGGFGVSYHDDQKFDIEKIAEGTRRAIQNYKRNIRVDSTFIFELGRYLVTEAGIYVAKIVSHKESRGKLYFILEGGLNHHIAASGNFGQIIKKNFIVKNLSNPEGEIRNCNLVGPLCTTLDTMGRDISVESPRKGDLIAFFNSGSYGFTSSPLFFLGHETPAELLVEENNLRIIRKRSKLIDFN